MNTPVESALVILIPEAEVLVESFRRQHDPSAALGVPAHVTVLYPFKSPRELTADVIQTLKELFSKFPVFSASLIDVRRFPGVLYLSPVPDKTFRRLTEIVTKRFPETLPYAGQFADISKCVAGLLWAWIREPTSEGYSSRPLRDCSPPTAHFLPRGNVSIK